VVEGSDAARRQREGDDKTGRPGDVSLLLHGDAGGEARVCDGDADLSGRAVRHRRARCISSSQPDGFTHLRSARTRSTIYCTDVAKMVERRFPRQLRATIRGGVFITQLALDFRRSSTRTW